MISCRGMLKSLFSLGHMNKILVFITLVSLSYKRGHFSGTLIPAPFQILLILSLILTTVYLLKSHQVKKFFLSIPKKIWLAVGGLFFSVLLGWVIGEFFVGMPTSTATILDFGTFTISLIMFLLVLFYTKNDEKYAKWYLYALFIPNLSILYYFLTHGIVGFWGVPNDGSLTGIVDPNVSSKALLIPALFFITKSLFAFKNNQWWRTLGYALLASVASMMIFWTLSRGSILGMIIGMLLIFVLYSVRNFSWKNFLGGIAIVFVIVSVGYIIVPHGVKGELHTKIVNTGQLPVAPGVPIADIVKDPVIVTTEELQATPRSEVRILEWSYFIKYALLHPLGVGPTSSSIDYQSGADLQLRPGNTYIQVWLWGGIIGTISFLYLVYRAFRGLWMRWKNSQDQHALALLGILFALSITITFDASLYFYWFFIILALSLQKQDILSVQSSIS